ncbi:MAG: serine protease [Kiritimatiellae bacterium]|jgi:S1-C subfamily serine protease|nr:serine protease [Kiritimatiellia bacterium]
MTPNLRRVACVALISLSLCLEQSPADNSEWEWHPFPLPLKEKIGFGAGYSWVFSLHGTDGLCVFAPDENRYLIHEHILEKNQLSAVSGNWFISSDPETGDTRVWDLESGEERGRFFVSGEGKLIGWVGHPEADDHALAVMIHPFGQNNADIRLLRIRFPDGGIVETMRMTSQGKYTSSISRAESTNSLPDFSVIRLGLGTEHGISQWQIIERIGWEYLPSTSPKTEPLFFSRDVRSVSTRGVPAHGADVIVSVDSNRKISVVNPNNGHVILRVDTPPRQSSGRVRPPTFIPRELPFLDVTHHRMVYLPNFEGGLFTRRLHLAKQLRTEGRPLAIPLADSIPPVIPGEAWSYRPAFLTAEWKHPVSLRVMPPSEVTVDKDNVLHFTPNSTHIGGLTCVVQAEYEGGVFEYTLRARPAIRHGQGEITAQFELRNWDSPNLFIDTGGEVDTLLPALDRNGVLFRLASDQTWGFLDVLTTRIRFLPDATTHTLLAAGGGKAATWNAASNILRVYSLPGCVEIAKFPNPLENPLIGLVMGENRDDIALLVAVDRHRGQSRWTFDYVDLSTGKRLDHHFQMEKNMNPARPVNWFASPDLRVITFRARASGPGWTSARPAEGTWIDWNFTTDQPLHPLSGGRLLRNTIFDEEKNVSAKIPQEEWEASNRNISWKPLPGIPLVYALHGTTEPDNMSLQIRRTEDFSLFLDLQGPPNPIFAHAPRSRIFDLHKRTLLNLESRRLVLAPRALPGLVIAKINVPAELELPTDPPSAPFPEFRRSAHTGDSVGPRPEPTLSQERDEKSGFHFSDDAREKLADFRRTFAKRKSAIGGWSGIREKSVPSVVELRGPRSAGTAFAISQDGLMVTSKTALPPYGQPFSLRIPHASGGILEYPGVVVAWHEQHEIVLVRPLHDRKWVPLHLEVREAPRQGDSLAVLGNPLNEGQPLYHTFREGVLSHTSRLIDGLTHFQISIASTPGLPGSPVLDRNGNVIAVVSGEKSTAEGVGFAIPSTVIMEKFIEFERNSTGEE